MNDPASLRAVRIVAQWLAEDPALPSEVPIDLRDFSNDVAEADKPALFAVIVNTDAVLDRESDLGVVEPLGISLVGYVKAPMVDGVPPPVTETRERFLQAVLARIAAHDNGDSLVARLRADRAAVGSGAESFAYFKVHRNELGQAPPWGAFEIRCLAMLHYQEGEF